jgi:hypothetical protein
VSHTRESISFSFPVMMSEYSSPLALPRGHCPRTAKLPAEGDATQSALGHVCAKIGPDSPDPKDLRLSRTSSPVGTILRTGIQ